MEKRERELHLLADQQVRRVEKELEKTNERFNDVTTRMLRYRARIAELEERKGQRTM